MRRDFTTEAIAPELVDELCDLTRRAPSAGNSQGFDIVALEGPDQTMRYWDVTLPPERRGTFAWPGLLRAPVLLVVVTTPSVYVDRYAEGDKVATGLGRGAEAWEVPFWHVDAGMAIEHLLLAAVDAGLGACFFGVFAHAARLGESLGIPDDRVIVGTVALGHPTEADRPGRSASRARRPLDEVVHRGRW